MISKCAHIVHTFGTIIVVQGTKVDRGIHLKFSYQLIMTLMIIRVNHREKRSKFSLIYNEINEQLTQFQGSYTAQTVQFAETSVPWQMITSLIAQGGYDCRDLTPFTFAELPVVISITWMLRICGACTIVTWTSRGSCNCETFLHQSFKTSIQIVTMNSSYNLLAVRDAANYVYFFLFYNYLFTLTPIKITFTWRIVVIWASTEVSHSYQ